MRGGRGDSAVERFSLAQRVEHFLLLISFNVLVITGLPQKYSGEGWGERLIVLFGGIGQTRFIHRTVAVILVALGLYHLLVVVATRKRPVRRHDMNLSIRDIRDMFADLRFLSGRSQERPRFGRFDYRQKFEYLAVLWGTVIMAVTGLIMWFPSLVTQWLPGVVVPAARVAHGGEALLAMLSVVLWHFYNAHFRPDVFPMDPAMFSGKITVERLRHEHPEEFDELQELGMLPEGHSPEPAGNPPAPTGSGTA
ncbi:MAG: cytochrome b/b6 domain-containing protein [bacterium]|nr:cytochrome b/b6 domain-containing protein [bacterium]